MRSQLPHLSGVAWTCRVQGATLVELQEQAVTAWRAFAPFELHDRLLVIDVDPLIEDFGSTIPVSYHGTAYARFDI